MIINLIFVALMCYYFKRKYDYLELAQNEQAKILYQLIHKQGVATQQPSSPLPSSPMDFSQDPLVNHILADMESVDDSDSDSDESDNNDVNEVTVMETPSPETKVVELSNTEHVTIEEVAVEEVLDITVNVSDTTTEPDYNKMSMKQLKEILSSKGIKPKTNIKKDELVELITNEVRV